MSNSDLWRYSVHIQGRPGVLGRVHIFSNWFLVSDYLELISIKLPYSSVFLETFKAIWHCYDIQEHDLFSSNSSLLFDCILWNYQPNLSFYSSTNIMSDTQHVLKTFTGLKCKTKKQTMIYFIIWLRIWNVYI